MLILFACCLSCIVIGQETIKKTDRTATKEWGINATKLLAWGLRRNQNLTSISPYAMSYKAIQANGNTFRLGFGADWYEEVPKNDDNYEIKLSLRLGYEKQIQLSPQSLIYVGVDFTNGFEHFRGEPLWGNAFGLGGGPLAGIQYMIHPKISLYTETALYYNFLNKANVHELNFILPTALYLAFRY